ncbi:hypothetical protein [Nocardia aurantiaca]|uniref:DUF4149 domain-containing protein n=1 Tax=Nocardia aurantiaca TaxID=2675850 RepID=A0A6I3L3N0_9NOCA|nr:hypothetical protein [Nocardia aurantiaca]MTE15195.1 hypothetical protein [Nocardia aurantiaca]
MTASRAVVTATIFVWLGMVMAISFLEAPLKFRAPKVTVQIGLGIGRLVFRALNSIESLLAITILVAIAVDPPTTGTIAAFAVAAGALITQLAIVRPRLTRHSDAVLAGGNAPRSHSHYTYVGLETTKVVALLTGGALALATT